jgi:hypothetical protein
VLLHDGRDTRAVWEFGSYVLDRIGRPWEEDVDVVAYLVLCGPRFVAVLKILLKVKPGLGQGYDWVECGACGAGRQAPHYAPRAKESVG